jgi:uncharacterized membrane protein YtjA (UPF0391 family)
MNLLSLAVVFLVFALIAYVVGARGVAGFSMEIARFLVWIFVVLFVVTMLVSVARGWAGTLPGS